MIDGKVMGFLYRDDSCYTIGVVDDPHTKSDRVIDMF